MKRSTLFVLAAVLASAGCVTPPPKRIVDLEKVTPLTGLAPLPVRCAPEIWTKVEKMTMLGLPISFSTGEEFTAIFNGTGADQPVVEIVESSLSGRITDLGFTGLFTYQATISFTSKGVRHEFKAEHTRTVHGFETPATSVKITVDTVLADLYRQVLPLL